MEQRYYLMTESDYHILQRSLDRAIHYCESATSIHSYDADDDSIVSYAAATGYSQGTMQATRTLLDGCKKHSISS